MKMEKRDFSIKNRNRKFSSQQKRKLKKKEN